LLGLREGFREPTKSLALDSYHVNVIAVVKGIWARDQLLWSGSDDRHNSFVKETIMAAGVRKLKPTEYQGDESSVDDNRVMFTGGNVEMRLSEADDDSNVSMVSLWRVLYSPCGPGHTLFLKSDLTEHRWNIYSDNAPLTRLLQQTVQGMLNPALKDEAILVVEAAFRKTGDTRESQTEHVEARGVKIAMTWSEFGEPILVHSHPNKGPIPRSYGVCAVIFPALAARLTINGVQAKGRAWPRERMGRPYSTCLVGFSESWTGPR
jgi:hypothetical protein